MPQIDSQNDPIWGPSWVVKSIQIYFLPSCGPFSCLVQALSQNGYQNVPNVINMPHSLGLQMKEYYNSLQMGGLPLGLASQIMLFSMYFTSQTRTFSIHIKNRTLKSANINEEPMHQKQYLNASELALRIIVHKCMVANDILRPLCF